MATGGSPGSGFQPETIQFVISTIEDIWAERSEEKLEAVFAYLRSEGVKCESDVWAIDDSELTKLMGPKATRSIVEHLLGPKRTEEARERATKKEKTYFKQGPGGATYRPGDPHPQRGSAADSGKDSQQAGDGSNNMQLMFNMFREMHADERKKNRKLIKGMNKDMQETLKEVTGTMMTTVKDINDKLTAQMSLQQQLLKKLDGQVVAMETRHQEMASQTRQWMINTQNINNKLLLELTRKVNAALESKQDTKRQYKAAVSTVKPQSDTSCNLL